MAIKLEKDREAEPQDCIEHLLEFDIQIQAASSGGMNGSSSDKTGAPIEIRPSNKVLAKAVRRKYDFILDNAIGTILGQGLVFYDDESWGDGGSMGLPFFSRFKLRDFPNAGRFDVVFTLHWPDEHRTNADYRSRNKVINCIFDISWNDSRSCYDELIYRVDTTNIFDLQARIAAATDEYKRETIHDSGLIEKYQVELISRNHIL